MNGNGLHQAIEVKEGSRTSFPHIFINENITTLKGDNLNL